VTKADIIESVYEKVGFSKKEAAEIVEMVFDTIKETLEQGEKIKISGFGNFIVRDKKSRVGRNPQTGEEIEISARRVLTFRPSQVLGGTIACFPTTVMPLESWSGASEDRCCSSVQGACPPRASTPGSRLSND